MPATNIVSAAGHKSDSLHQNNQNYQKSSGGFFRTAIDSIGGLTRRSAGKAGSNGGFSKEKYVGMRSLGLGPVGPCSL